MKTKLEVALSVAMLLLAGGGLVSASGSLDQTGGLVGRTSALTVPGEGQFPALHGQPRVPVLRRV